MAAEVRRDLTRPITERCDRLADDCDGVLYGAVYLDGRLDRLNTHANYAQVQTSMLSLAQADLIRQRRALSWRVFWQGLYPRAVSHRVHTMFGGR